MTNKAANKRSAGKLSMAKLSPAKGASRKTASTGGGKKTTAKKATAKKTTAKKAAAKKTTAKKAAAKKASPKKATAKKATAKKASPKKADKRGAIERAAKKAAPKRKRGGKAGVSDPPDAPPSSKRNFGLRGAAPWVARHAAKHAEELRRRNAEPPPPGSARATLRTPKEAEQIKSRVAELHQRTSQIRTLRKKLDKSFYEIGLLLAEVQRLELHDAKGYSTFESFLDREVELPRSVSLRLIRICHTFQRETAYDFGIERLGTALAALDGEITQAAPSHPSSRGWSSAGMPVKPPPIRFDD